jgi:hypothetical protein
MTPRRMLNSSLKPRRLLKVEFKTYKIELNRFNKQKKLIKTNCTGDKINYNDNRMPSVKLTTSLNSLMPTTPRLLMLRHKKRLKKVKEKLKQRLMKIERKSMNLMNRSIGGVQSFKLLMKNLQILRQRELERL